MSHIETFPFDKDSSDKIKEYHFGQNWPVVYVLQNSNEAYVGQTINVFNRSRQHLENSERRKLDTIHVISDEEFNVSAALDVESWLIQYLAADGQFVLQNGNGGLKNHNYYDKEKYKTKFELTWESMRSRGLAKQSLVDLRNSDLFKYSPYKSLNEEQYNVVKSIAFDIKTSETSTCVVQGKPGTGKTIVASFLAKYLKEHPDTKHLNIALVVPMTSLRKTLQSVFRRIKGLGAGSVIGPSEVTRGSFDVVLVDEAHRLQRRKGIMGYGAFDKINSFLGLDQNGTQLDWIMKSSKHQIFFYDPNQTVKPADIRPADFSALHAKTFSISKQMRIGAGEPFVDFIDAVFDGRSIPQSTFPNYDLRVFDDVGEMVQLVKEKNQIHGLSRVVAGYAWPWHTGRDNPTQDYDIDIDGIKLIWNSQAQDWVNSLNAINEVGCIHTVQGYDLNYVGVIIGPELQYDFALKKFCVDKNKYFDINGRKGISDPFELERYVINIYKTLLTRGMMGVYIYVCNPELRRYLDSVIGRVPKREQVAPSQIYSPYAISTVLVPVLGTAPCGNPFVAEENTEEMISVDSSKIRKGYQYFVIRAEGDSMNLAGIQDGDLLLCRQQLKADTGDRVVALLGGESVTVKVYDKEDGRRVLRPKSTNRNHQTITPDEGDSVQGVVQEVIEMIESDEQ